MNNATAWNPYGAGDVPGMITDVKTPTIKESNDIYKTTRKPVAKVLTVTEPNGDTVKVAQDANGETVATKIERGNLGPLVMLGGLAWLLFS